MSIKFKFATEQDFEEIAKLFIKHDFDFFPAPLSKRWSVKTGVKRDFSGSLSDEERMEIMRFRTRKLAEWGKWIIALKGDELVGALVASTKSCVIESVLVSSEHRRKGVGTLLVKEALEYLSKQGCKKIRTKTWSGNYRIISMLSKLGFELVETKKEFKGDVERESAVLERNI